MVNLVFGIVFMLITYAITVYIYKKRYNTSKQNIFLAGIYLLIGIVIGILYTIYGYDTLKVFKALNIISVALIVAGIDYREKIIPNEAVVFILSFACIFILLNVFKSTT